jgi:TRAP-type C4-dicarboxylate transport system permease small subunit
MLTRVIDSYFRLLRFFIAAALAVMVVLVFGNVVLRYAFNSGITVSEELSRWLFVWLTFIGAIVAMRDRAHLGMDSVVSRLPLIGKKICFVVSNLLMLYVVWLFASGAWQQTIINMDNRAPATGLSSGLYYGIGVFFCVSAAAIIVFHLFQVVTGRMTEAELIQVRESEEDVKHAAEESEAGEAVDAASSTPATKR